MRLHRSTAILALALLLAGCVPFIRHKEPIPYDLTGMDTFTADLYRVTHGFITEDGPGLDLHPATRIDSIRVDEADGTLRIFLNDAFGYRPVRDSTVARVYRAIGRRLGRTGQDYRITLRAGRYPFEDLVPNHYRDPGDIDYRRIPLGQTPRPRLVTPLNRPWHAPRGLEGRYIAMWPSHGWYYNPSIDAWSWQRARVFRTVEDLLPFAFIEPYLAPMLENAGAHVLMPRERDLQINEVIVDNDDGDSLAYRETGPWQTAPDSAFGRGMPPYHEGETPFAMGTARRIATDSVTSAAVRWIPDLPERGDYRVSVAWPRDSLAVSDAEYAVYHAGGVSRFRVDQRIGAGTWIYLGRFTFPAGRNPDSARVVLSNRSEENGHVVADAVRFGGGMGNVARNGRTSGRPRFMEGARYWMQYAGIPDTLVYNITAAPDSDYVDDYRGRAEWVNWLAGAPYGPNKRRSASGLGIPVDLSLAFHTDAGRTPDDSTIGTLMIFSTTDARRETLFPDGVSRLAARDLGDIMQTELTRDLRARYRADWTRRSLWDRRYSEAFRPNVPAALLELLSHHNYADMAYALDPRFRFDAARAIYKGILRFLETQSGEPLVVQPLPVDHLEATWNAPGKLRVRWSPRVDSLEASAVPDHYVVHLRRGGGGFDNGLPVQRTELVLDDLEPGVVYSVMVRAVNGGGASMPSEKLAAAWLPNAPTVLVVNGFDRVSGPAGLESGDLAGFAGFVDEGVADRIDFSTVGDQYGFDRTGGFRNNDAAGHGASFSDLEETLSGGNRFDYPAVHGRAILAAGYGFASVSDETLISGRIDPAPYPAIDLILGEEKATPRPGNSGVVDFEPFPSALQAVLAAYLDRGGSMLVSGAYVGRSLVKGTEKDDPRRSFARDVLRLRWHAGHAARTGRVMAIDSTFWPLERPLAYNVAHRPDHYRVEAPDAIAPADSLGRTILRYAENHLSAAIAWEGPYRVIVAGFPLETIPDTADRRALLGAMVRWLMRE